MTNEEFETLMKEVQSILDRLNEIKKEWGIDYED